MPTIRMTNAIIENLTVEQRTDYTDAATSNLILRVTPKGTKTWSIRYKDRSGNYRRFTLGAFPEMGYITARLEALRVKGRHLDGCDPQGDRVARRTDTTVEEAADLFFGDLRRTKRAESTIAEYKSRYQKHINPAFGHRAVRSLARAEIRKWLRGFLDTPGTTNNLHTTFSSLLTFCADEGYIEASPMWRMKRLTETEARKRIYQPEEIRKIWESLPDSLAARALKVHLLTGQRSSEVCGMRISGLDGPWWYLTPPETKPKREHLVYLSPAAYEIVRGLVGSRENGYVFQSEHRADQPTTRASHADTFRKLKLPDARPHDFRRTFISWLYSQELPEHVIAALVNQSGGGRGDGKRKAAPVSRTVYNHFSYLPQREKWMLAWGEYVSRCVSGQDAEVLTFRRRA